MRHPQRGERNHPDQIAEVTLVAKLEASDRQRRDSGHAGVAAEELQVAEQVIQADAPGDRRQRQIVAPHAQGDEAQSERDQRRQDEPDDEVEPGQPRPGLDVRRQVRRDVGADPDERRLPERGLAGDSGEQH